MADSTDVYDYIASTGTIVADAGTILNQVNTEYQNAFGQNLIVPDSINQQGANTPQGSLIIAETLARTAVADNNVSIANQINPNLSGGIFLDAILALTGIARDPAQSSAVYATITGVFGTIIPMGSQASDSVYGNIFSTTQTYTIPEGGVLTNVQFNSVQTGSIPCNEDTLTNIISQILGWETIQSNTSAILGSTTQSDIAARAYRNLTLASQGSSIAQAITSGVLQVPGVTSMTFLENTSSSTQVIEGTTMAPHSIYACVSGGGIGNNTIVYATLTGTNGTVIPAGSIASSYQFSFETTETVTIPIGGILLDVEFQAIQTGSIPCPPNSLNFIQTPISGWASVNNPSEATSIGIESTVAQALVSKKSAGASYNNGNGINISTVVTVPYSDQLMTILFDTPNIILINVTVNVRVITPVSDPYSAVQTSILNYANGLLNGQNGLTVGQNVSSYELSGAIITQYPGIYVQSLFISLNPSVPTSPDEIEIGVYQIASVLQENITVNVL